MPKKFDEKTNFFDYLRFGESYTSLILGIVVVIVSTVLLLSFVHNKNIGTKNNPQQTQKVAQASVSPEASVSATAKVVTLAAKPTAAPTLKSSPTPVKTAEKPKVVVEAKGDYKVKKGDTLWSIAEKEYKSGYNWVDIARVNNLNNPNAIHVGDKLVLPKVQTKTVAKVTPKVTAKVTPQVQESKKVELKNVSTNTKITANDYKVVQGDNLWNIAVRAYGDGYQWVKIAKANKLINPNIIHPGNKLTLPRGK